MALIGTLHGQDIQVIAAGTIAQYAVVKLSTDSSDGDLRVVVSAAASDTPFGVAQEAASSGDSILVRISGISLVKADGAFTLGDELQVNDANGEVDTFAASAGDTDYVVGIALHGATAAGDTMPMLIRMYARQTED
jgi:hypothetical protein